MSCELGVTVLTCKGYQIFSFYKSWLEEDAIALCIGKDAIALVVEVENAITLVVLGRMRSRFSIGEDAIALCAGEDALYLVCSVRFTRGT
ncbi:hypothetical protein NDI37_25195 [Funiculus sociatus GB2-A5]|uniref:Uncharacterized protein n=1 Tax=Funiculus sociatus GB2-A5 TaxID=2933946 RepID=A0ABV0JWB1_9CYAN|nr:MULTISPECIES: hypothetical protein [unclassified Trichocoleus]MBD1905517.1 hypothetical protein [Trichocoleus sp. FACHB-832]MBD2065048.1 hypothetical protein [Trichocoleus sp. FACHB-6]